MTLLPNTLILALFSFFCASLSSVAQTGEIDKLIQKIESYDKQDTSLVNLHIKLGKLLIESDQTKAKEQFLTTKELALKLNYTSGLGHVYFGLGNIYRKTSAVDSARIFYLESLRSFQAEKHSIEYGNCYNAIGVTYYIENNLDEALNSFLTCIETDEKYNHPYNTDCLNNIGSIHGRRGNTEKALYYFKKVLDIKLKSEDQTGIDGAYNNLGVVNDSQGNWDKALYYYQKANKAEQKSGDTESMMISFLNIGRVYFKQKELDKALKYYHKSIRIARQYGNKFVLSKALTHAGIIFGEQKKFKKSIDYHSEAIQISEELGAKQNIGFALSSMGQTLLDLDSTDRALSCLLRAEEINLGLNNELGTINTCVVLTDIYISMNNWDKALSKAKIGINLAKKRNEPATLIQFNKLLSKIYEKKGNFEKALYHFKEFKVQSDSLYNQENVQKIAQIEFDYLYSDSLDAATKRELELSNKIKESKLDTAQSRQFSLWLGVGLLLILLIATLIIAILVVRNTRTKFNNIAVEQKLLRTQMTPHFLFNSMSIIQGMILNGSYQKSLDYINDFSRLLRITLENSRNKTVSLDKELEAVSRYVSLQNKTSQEPYDCQIHVNSDTDPAKVVIPPMLIQPFVENAIEHGFNEEMKDKQINVTIEFDEGDLICVITDNGVGINQTISQEKATKKSMATEITKDRLKLLASEFKVRTSFTINDRSIFSEKGTVVNLILPYKRIPNG